MTTSLRRESAMRFAEGGTVSVTEIAGDPSPDQASSHRRATLFIRIRLPDDGR